MQLRNFACVVFQKKFCHACSFPPRPQASLPLTRRLWRPLEQNRFCRQQHRPVSRNMDQVRIFCRCIAAFPVLICSIWHRTQRCTTACFFITERRNTTTKHVRFAAWFGLSVVSSTAIYTSFCSRQQAPWYITKLLNGKQKLLTKFVIYDLKFSALSQIQEFYAVSNVH